MSKVLVAYATLNGTAESLAYAIGQQLEQAGLPTETHPADDVITLRGYHSVILGSEIWQGDWLPGAREFLDSFQDALRERSVWLFSSQVEAARYRAYPAALASLVDYVRPLGTAVFVRRGDAAAAAHEVQRWSQAITAHLDTVLRVRA
jgi:menaquinone-dependent protoporphyrinogen IX oxidase